MTWHQFKQSLLSRPDVFAKKDLAVSAMMTLTLSSFLHKKNWGR